MNNQAQDKQNDIEDLTNDAKPTRRDVIKTGGAMLAGLAASGLFGSANAQSEKQTGGMKRLAGKTALVTGAARGIGRATAVALAQEGANVALLDIADPQGVKNIYDYRLSNRDELREAARLVEAAGAKSMEIVADVRNLAAMKKAANDATSKFGGLDILVANAGVAIWSPFEEMKPEQWQDVIDVNLTGTANSMWATIPQMKKQKSGRIITLSSVGGRYGVPGVANYASTKWAIIGLTKTAALELGKYNITVNAIAPTAVNTPLYRSKGQQHSTGVDSEQAQDAQVLPIHALPIPALEPKDIADGIVFLSSDEAKYISGLTLDIAAGGNARYTA